MLRLPIIRGRIDRRILVNFRCDPDPLHTILPPMFRPKLVAGHSMAGICLIRLQQVRPRRFPHLLGLGSENAAHRIAVEWDDPIDRSPRKASSSRSCNSPSLLNHFVGGRIFPGVHHRAAFDVREDDRSLHVAFQSDDSTARVSVDARLATALPPGSVFRSLDEASNFFRGGAVGYSPAGAGRLDGLELNAFEWQVTPLEVLNVESSFFADAAPFAARQRGLDNALLMRGIEHEWLAHPPIDAHEVDRRGGGRGRLRGGRRRGLRRRRGELRHRGLDDSLVQLLAHSAAVLNLPAVTSAASSFSSLFWLATSRRFLLDVGGQNFAR